MSSSHYYIWQAVFENAYAKKGKARQGCIVTGFLFVHIHDANTLETIYATKYIHKNIHNKHKWRLHHRGKMIAVQERNIMHRTLSSERRNCTYMSNHFMTKPFVVILMQAGNIFLLHNVKYSCFPEEYSGLFFVGHCMSSSKRGWQCVYRLCALLLGYLHRK